MALNTNAAITEQTQRFSSTFDFQLLLLLLLLRSHTFFTATFPASCLLLQRRFSASLTSGLWAPKARFSHKETSRKLDKLDQKC